MRTRRGSAGFTLVEILIALVVLSIALAGMIPVLVSTTRGNSFGKDMTQAAAYSQDMLERLKAEVFTNVVPGTDTPATGFTRTWTVTNTGGIYNADVVGIEVSTSWTDANGVARTARAFTVRSNLR